MDWAIAFGIKLLRFLKGEFDFVLTGLAIAFAAYVVLYLFWPRTSPRSLRGFLHFTFPYEVFRHARVDFIAYILGKLAWAPLVAKILGFVVLDAMALHLLGRFFGERVLTATNSWLVLLTQFLVYYFASNFSYYWAHRAMHQNRFLWSVHRPHHSAESMTFMTGGRVHPVESIGVALWTTLWTGGAAAVLNYSSGIAMHPLLPVVISSWLILTEVSDALQHSHLRTSLGPLNYIFPLGLMHQVHHSAEPKHRDRNFGNGSALFDWMFGTIYIPVPGETILLGMSEEEIGAQNPHKGAADLYLEPFAYAWRVAKESRLFLTGRPGVSSMSPARTNTTPTGR